MLCHAITSPDSNNRDGLMVTCGGSPSTACSLLFARDSVHKHVMTMRSGTEHGNDQRQVFDVAEEVRVGTCGSKCLCQKKLS